MSWAVSGRSWWTLAGSTREIEWIEGDAQELPFEAGAFDVVTSAIGVMFAPDHRKAAAELLRVCRPGGTIGMANWPPVGTVADFFQTFAPFAPPPPPGWQPPTLWGDEQYVRDLLADGISHLEARERKLVVEHFSSPEEFCDYYRSVFGPTIATYAALDGDPQKMKELDEASLANARATNLSEDGARTRYELEYTLMVARRS